MTFDSSKEKCGWCVYHDNESICRMPKIVYGEDYSVETDFDSYCEMFTRDGYEGIHTIAITPGHHVGELMLARNLHVKNLPERQTDDLVDGDIAGVLTGRTRIDERIAKKLEDLFGVSAGFWLNLQSGFDEDLKKVKEEMKEEK